MKNFSSGITTLTFFKHHNVYCHGPVTRRRKNVNPAFLLLLLVFVLLILLFIMQFLYRVPFSHVTILKQYRLWLRKQACKLQHLALFWKHTEQVRKPQSVPRPCEILFFPRTPHLAVIGDHLTFMQTEWEYHHPAPY